MVKLNKRRRKESLVGHYENFELLNIEIIIVSQERRTENVESMIIRQSIIITKKAMTHKSSRTWFFDTKVMLFVIVTELK